MKVLIVDDEVIIRTGLCRVIDWEQNGFTILEPASSAEEAMRRIPAERPEIVFTDIRMTGKSGLDLIRETKTNCPDTEWIVISGYDEFSYAQQAIREGVSEYLLKTSRPDEIVRAALRAKERLAERRKREELGREKDRLLNRSFLGRLLAASSEPDEEEVRELYERYPRLRPADGQRLQVWLISAADGVPGSGNPHPRDALYAALGDWLMQKLPCEWLPWNSSLLLLVLIRVDCPGKRPMEALLRNAETELGCTLFAACGQAVGGAHILREALETAETARSYAWLLQDRRIIRHEDIHARKGCRGICTQGEEAELASLLKSGDESALNDWIMQRLEELRRNGEATPATAAAYLQSLLLAGHRWLERAAASIGYAGQLTDMEGSSRMTLAADPQPELFRRLKSIMDEYRLIVSDTTPAERAATYIREHLEENLSLAQVARHVHMNPNYFSEVFKRETGQNYIEFVTEARLQKAMELLRETPAKISEVAKRIGYEDIKYFNRLFKRFTGQTPSEYRDNS
ncbi:helix-turn-helix domain-containing protein [Paenibacillus sp. VCA1]|uniref:response regulator transcription factor n=1 Tax=Paenibacillus sp. VCA1 TaxID=3039148 RepID=UPI00287251E6|nr:helix-turn-helix domain-containing protein [Paenibacillus sp. VCA1]MDR9852168.1 helix-turn-helix domain-containing protein [Paenibacillus sp. VCA1]